MCSHRQQFCIAGLFLFGKTIEPNHPPIPSQKKIAAFAKTNFFTESYILAIQLDGGIC
jgi:hypothetical protein